MHLVDARWNIKFQMNCKYNIFVIRQTVCTVLRCAALYCGRVHRLYINLLLFLHYVITPCQPRHAICEYICVHSYEFVVLYTTEQKRNESCIIYMSKLAYLVQWSDGHLWIDTNFSTFEKRFLHFYYYFCRVYFAHAHVDTHVCEYIRGGWTHGAVVFVVQKRGKQNKRKMWQKATHKQFIL